MKRLPFVLSVIFSITFLSHAQYVASNTATGLNYTSVQQAIDAADSDYTVFVFTDINENLIIDAKTNMVLTKSNELMTNPVLSGNRINTAILIQNNSYSVNISSLSFSNNGIGIDIYQSKMNILESNIFKTNSIAIGIDNVSPSNFILNNYICEFDTGLHVSSEDCIIFSNKIINGSTGIYCANNNNNISYNLFKTNIYGVRL